MANSAMRLFYDKPCLETYGRKNTSGNNGFIYNDYMKTHNVQPHRHENEPNKYQTYRSSLNFGKRAKLDPEERWKKIHRQMVTKLDIKALVEDHAEGFIPFDGATVEEVLKLNINTLKGQKINRSKSLDYLSKTSAARDMLTTAQTRLVKNNLNSTVDTSRMGKTDMSRMGKADTSRMGKTDMKTSRTGQID